jgi:3-methyladenine DNA glycosylase AlkD
MNQSKDILKVLISLSNKEKKEFLPRFFKTGKGEYGEGDIFWGITVPNIREVAKRYFKNISLEDVKPLLNNEVHEVRLTGYIILTYKFEKGDINTKREIYHFYINNLDGCNNWDIVDLSCYKILGEYLYISKESTDILYDFARSKNMWKQRISIVSTFSFIKKNEFKHTLEISKILLKSKEDLIQKAIGWMLREVGKRDIGVLREFLNTNIKDISRTSLRYAIERMDEKERKVYLKM